MYMDKSFFLQYVIPICVCNMYIWSWIFSYSQLQLSIGVREYSAYIKQSSGKQKHNLFSVSLLCELSSGTIINRYLTE